MKTNPLMLLALSAIPVLFALVSFTETETSVAYSPSTSSPPPPTKVQIDICNNIIGAVEITQEIQAFVSGVRNSNGQSLAGGLYKIGKTDLNTLETNIVSLHDNLGGHTCKQYFPAVQIFFGKSNDTIKYFYKKICFCSNTDDYSVNKSFVVTSLSPAYFVYKGGQFVSAGPAATPVLETYSNTVKFLEYNSTVPRNFYNVNTKEGDALAIMLPLQVANTVLDKNNSDTLTLHNIGIEINGTTNKLRHSIALGPNMKGRRLDLNTLMMEQKDRKLTFLLGYAGNMANRSNLCPPSCTDAMFTATTNLVCE